MSAIAVPLVSSTPVDYGHWGSIKKVCVIGAGTMGSGIAAHLANLGFEVTLLDLTMDSVRRGMERAENARPPFFFLSDTADKIRIGSIQDNLDWISESDWICEAIVEKLDAKKALFDAIEGVIPDTAAITTNTSGLEIKLLGEGRSESFRQRFMGTHFFNPPRYLKLLELIPTSGTDDKAVKAMGAFLEEKCARRVVVAKDTPGFIANRFGMWAMIHAIHVTERLGLTVEQVDAITGPFLGRPRSASYRLNDIVGLDIMEDIARNLFERCPNDPHRGNLKTPVSMALLLDKGWIGDKAGQGYYRREGKEFVAFDLVTHAYRQRIESAYPELEAMMSESLGSRVAKVLDQGSEAGEFLRHHLIPVLKYADYLKEEISHSVLDFDRVMKWGFGWEMGPFEMMDAIGIERFDIAEPFYGNGTQRSFSGGYSKVKEEPEYRQLTDYPIVEKGQHLNVRDLGDGILSVALTSKMGTITPDLLAELNAWLDQHDGRFVFASEARHFSLGFNLNWFIERIDGGEFQEIDHALDLLQRTAIKFSTKRIVSAVHGYCLGAGLELALQCPRVVALSDAMIGFPEAKVGLFPGGAGTAELALRAQPMGAKAVVEVARLLTNGDTSANADQARHLGYIRGRDYTIYHPERLITEAREQAKVVEPLPRPLWQVPAGPITGMIDQALAEMKAKGQISDHGVLIGEKIKSIVAKSTSFEHACEQERALFIELCRHALTHARIRHMLDTGKPLAN